MVFKVTGTDVVMKCKSLDIFFKKKRDPRNEPLVVVEMRKTSKDYFRKKVRKLGRK